MIYVGKKLQRGIKMGKKFEDLTFGDDWSRAERLSASAKP